MLDVRVKAVMFVVMGEFLPPCLGRFSSFIFIFTEMIGTMVLVLMGCGSAVFAGSAAGRLVQVSERWE